MSTTSDQVLQKGAILKDARRLVVKIGSGVLSSPTGLREERVQALVRDIVQVASAGREIVVVSSGAVASGQGRLRLPARPKTVRMKQAVAAVGQIDLMASYERSFASHGRHVAQILLTRDDFTNRGRYLNAEHTLTTLLELGIVPVINENDSVAVDEMKFGDNDLLSALTATLVDADLLVILSDVAGLYARDPQEDPTAPLIPLATQLDRDTLARAGGRTGTFGTGGMATKLEAARVATSAGIPTIIADGARARVLTAVVDPTVEIGTLILATGNRLTRRKHWIAYTLKPAGTLAVDQGARDAVVERRGSLLPPGLRAVDGHFGAGECVRCLDPSGQEFARGLVNYSDAELRQIAGVRTPEIEKRLGYKISDEVIHRDDLVITTDLSR
jgi:glutamate 5-kinase